ncbi:unnamed protein product [Rangifer tarandus platyrhynchus]|uniref:Uncharacterized protein n=1 Tax=Rangifer tarandus platyrhynchus TaxID=3082113 RepID=A0AC59ZN29_RANTA
MQVIRFLLHSLQSCPTLCNPMDWNLQAPLSMGFSRQEYWCGLPCPPPEDLPDSGIKLTPLMSPAFAGGFFITRTTWEVRELSGRMSISGERTEYKCPGLLGDRSRCLHPGWHSLLMYLFRVRGPKGVYIGNFI